MSDGRNDGPRNRILGEMHALDAELHRALNGDRANREATRAAARRYDDLLRSALTTLGNGDMVVEMVLEGRRTAREKVTRDLGTSGWDEPAPPPNLPPLPAAPGSDEFHRFNDHRQPGPEESQHLPWPRSQPPLTDEELAGYEVEATWDRGEVDWHVAIKRLVAEVRRLRSDEWLRAAAHEIGDREVAILLGCLAGDDVRAILRKHRDGQA